jgi:hypothetical protein
MAISGLYREKYANLTFLREGDSHRGRGEQGRENSLTKQRELIHMPRQWFFSQCQYYIDQTFSFVCLDISFCFPRFVDMSSAYFFFYAAPSRGTLNARNLCRFLPTIYRTYDS